MVWYPLNMKNVWLGKWLSVKNLIKTVCYIDPDIQMIVLIYLALFISEAKKSRCSCSVSYRQGLGGVSSQEGTISCHHKRPVQCTLVPRDMTNYQTRCFILKKTKKIIVNCNVAVSTWSWRETLSFITELVLLEVNMLWWCIKALVKIR